MRVMDTNTDRFALIWVVGNERASAKCYKPSGGSTSQRGDAARPEAKRGRRDAGLSNNIVDNNKYRAGGVASKKSQDMDTEDPGGPRGGRGRSEGD